MFTAGTLPNVQACSIVQALYASFHDLDRSVTSDQMFCHAGHAFSSVCKDVRCQISGLVIWILDARMTFGSANGSWLCALDNASLHLSVIHRTMLDFTELWPWFLCVYLLEMVVNRLHSRHGHKSVSDKSIELFECGTTGISVLACAD
jgi:hypothetical protein